SRDRRSAARVRRRHAPRIRGRHPVVDGQVRLAVVVLALVVAASGCSHVRPRSAPIGAAAELTQLADSGSKVIYQATYSYSTVGVLTPGITTRMQIVQRPPSSIRKLETSTPGPGVGSITVRIWQATD